MDECIKKLFEYIEKIGIFKLPNYELLPSIPLYMEQVTKYINMSLAPLVNDDNSSLITGYMVNNYVKAKIINPPKDKQYDDEHIAYLIFITLLKNSASLKDIATFIELDKEFIKDRKDLYNFYKKLQEQILQETQGDIFKLFKEYDLNAEEIENAPVQNAEEAQKITEENKENKKFSKEVREFARIALRLYIESETRKIVADTIMKYVNNSVLPQQVMKDSKKEEQFEIRKLEEEAKKLGNRK